MAKDRGMIEFIGRAACLRNGSVLVCKSVAGGYYYLPGGHVEFGEPAAAAVERELIEECGVEFTATDCALICEYQFRSGSRDHHEVNVVFHVELKQPNAAIQSREQDIAFEWLDLAALVDVDFRPAPIKAWLVAGGVSDRMCGWVGMPKGA